MPGAKAARPKPVWPMSLAVLLALATSLAGLMPVFDDPSWWFVSVGLATVVTVAIIGVRALSRFRWLPTLIGLVVLVIAVTFSFAPGRGYLGFIPSPDALGVFATLLADGRESIASQSIPAEPVTGIVFMLAIGAGVLAIVLDVIAQIVKRPALVGIPMLGLLLVPTFFAGGTGDPFAFFVAAGAYLVVLYLGLGEVRAGGAFGVGAIAVAAALIVPLALPPITPPEAESRGGFAVGINSFITLGDNLRRPNVTRVLTYSNDEDIPQYLTVSIISDFTGTTWEPEEPTVNAENYLLSIGPTPGLSPAIQTDAVTTSIDIVNMGGHWVPAPYAPTSITGLDGNWSFDDETLSVASPNLSVRGEQYVVENVEANPTVEQLQQSVTDFSADLDPYLELPSDLPEVVSTTALDVTAGAATNYDKAYALQQYFVGGQFEYSEIAPVEEGYDGTSAQVVSRFLAAKSGYCVHFSSAMALMARSLGIPARIAVGFTPGEYTKGSDDKPNFYSVTTENLHAWPELWFNDIGWVRFEPTPGRGISPSFARDNLGSPSSAPTVAPTTTPTTAPSVTPTPTPSATNPDIDNVVVDSPDQTLPRVVVGILVGGAIIIVLLPVVPIIVRGVRRQRRYWRVRRRGSALDAWAELNDTAIDLGWQTASLTPREFAKAARRGMSTSAVRALADLLVALEATAYSQHPSESVLRDLRVVRRTMLRLSTRRERIRALFSPASVSLRRRSRARR